MTDKELVREIGKGNQQVFRMLVEKYQSTIFKICNGFIHNKEDCEDIVQDVFIEVYQSIHNFRGEAKLTTWLYRIAVNKSLNYLRKTKIRRNILSMESLFGGDKSRPSEVEDNSIRPDENIEQNERARILFSALRALSTNQRIAFVLNKYEDLSYKEIAEIMNTSLPAVESLIHRAKINLQKKLYVHYKKKL
jgi:RNA polymerase sigma-70 factor (ECF subfamily)